jgi:hypothetical protein
MDDKEKLYLMLEEYRSVRTEQSDRMRLQHHLFALAVALGMGLATAGAALHRPVFFIALIIAQALLLGAPIALLEYEIHSAAKRVREIEYEMNTRTGDRLFARESDRPTFRINRASLGVEGWRTGWTRLRSNSGEYARRWRDGARQFRASLRRPSARTGGAERAENDPRV